MHFFSALSLGLRVWDRVQRDRQQSVPIIVHDQNAQRMFTSNGVPVQAVDVDPQEDNLKNYKAKPAKILGALQIVSGLVTVICQIVVTALQARAYEGFVGFWAPVLFILAGAFGIQSSKSKSRCTVIATMVLSIFSAVFSIAVIVAGAVGVGLAYDCSYYISYYSMSYDDCLFEMPDGNVQRSAAAFFSIMLISGVLEMNVAIVAACFCCDGCCRGHNPGVVIAQGIPTTQGLVQMPVGHFQHTSVMYPASVAPMPMASQLQVHHQPTPGFYPAPVPQMPTTYLPQNTAPPAYGGKV